MVDELSCLKHSCKRSSVGDFSALAIEMDTGQFQFAVKSWQLAACLVENKRLRPVQYEWIARPASIGGNAQI